MYNHLNRWADMQGLENSVLLLFPLLNPALRPSDLRGTDTIVHEHCYDVYAHIS